MKDIVQPTGQQSKEQNISSSQTYKKLTNTLPNLRIRTNLSGPTGDCVEEVKEPPGGFAGRHMTKEIISLRFPPPKILVKLKYDLARAKQMRQFLVLDFILQTNLNSAKWAERGEC